jgi:hypothetical protein
MRILPSQECPVSTQGLAQDRGLQRPQVPPRPQALLYRSLPQDRGLRRPQAPPRSQHRCPILIRGIGGPLNAVFALTGQRIQILPVVRASVVAPA